MPRQPPQLQARLAVAMPRQLPQQVQEMLEPRTGMKTDMTATCPKTSKTVPQRPQAQQRDR
jgi:hypothetical protein